MKRSYVEKVIARFESGWTGDKNALYEFVRNCEPVASSELQLDLLQVDLRLRLRAGIIPVASDYEDHFPHFMEGFGRRLASEVVRVICDASPIEDAFGGLPAVVGGYKVSEQVGRDWVSVHYDAYQVALSRKVRLRVLLFPTEQAIAKSRAVANFEHPNFESAIEVLRTPEISAVVAQIEHGESVAEVVRRRPEYVTTRHAVRLVHDAASSLLELHQHGVEHLNISPSTLIVRHSGGGVLTDPILGNSLDLAFDEGDPTLSSQLPFPYRSIWRSVGGSRSRRKDDVVALGLVLFVLLTKVSLHSFYRGKPLPNETQRLKTLIRSHLEFSSEMDPVLKSLCLRLTVGVLDGVNACELPELRDALLEWERVTDAHVKDEFDSHGKRPHLGSAGKPAVRGFRWF